MIERVEMLDQGTYICRANNDEGIGVHTYTGVEVLGEYSRVLGSIPTLG